MQQVVFSNGAVVELPERTVAAIAEAAAKYAAPLWSLREEGTLKLAGRQWIDPPGVAAARAAWAELAPGPAGESPALAATAWKLFNRDWRRAAEAYFVDAARYPDHPRHLGPGVVPLVDEDDEERQIGWARLVQWTEAGENYAVFVQFEVLDLFAPRPLGAEYA